MSSRKFQPVSGEKPERVVIPKKPQSKLVPLSPKLPSSSASPTTGWIPNQSGPSTRQSAGQGFRLHAEPQKDSPASLTFFSVLYCVVLAICLVFRLSVGTGELEIDLASSAGAVLLFLLTLGLYFIVDAVRDFQGAAMRGSLLFGLVLVGIPVSILLWIHIGGSWGSVAGGLACAIAIIMGLGCRRNRVA
jgi:hypothetical protein